MGRDKFTTKKDRLNFIRNLITYSFSNTAIAEEFAQHYGVTLRTAWKYVALVRKRFLEEVKEKTADNILDEYNQLIDKYELMDPKLARDYRIQRDKILGIIQQKVDITSGGKDIQQFVFGNFKPPTEDEDGTTKDKDL